MQHSRSGSISSPLRNESEDFNKISVINQPFSKLLCYTSFSRVTKMLKNKHQRIKPKLLKREQATVLPSDKTSSTRLDFAFFSICSETEEQACNNNFFTNHIYCLVLELFPHHNCQLENRIRKLTLVSCFVGLYNSFRVLSKQKRLKKAKRKQKNK